MYMIKYKYVQIHNNAQLFNINNGGIVEIKFITSVFHIT